MLTRLFVWEVNETDIGKLLINWFFKFSIKILWLKNKTDCDFWAVRLFYWWEEMDSNHRSLRQQIYSLLPLATREPSQLELVIGIEPTTCWLQISCSANWATPAYIFIWCLETDSNHRHKDFQSYALPTELPRQALATLRGLEPLTSSVTGWRTNQLYYRAKKFHGGPSRTRTADQSVMSRPL